MISNKQVLAVVPARGGSKGIIKKNLRAINGKPLVALVGDVIRKVPFIDKAVVSTDTEEIAHIAEKNGLEAPFLRPPNLSGDQVSDWEVLYHALLEVERIDKTIYDIIIMLQPTSPLRRCKHIVDAVQMLEEGNWDAVWSVSETDPKNHPLKQLCLNGGEMNYYDVRAKNIIARQQLPPLYQRNGVVYVMTRDCIIEQKTIKGRRTAGLILEGHFVSIDTEWDLELSEFILNRLPET